MLTPEQAMVWRRVRVLGPLTGLAFALCLGLVGYATPSARWTAYGAAVMFAAAWGLLFPLLVRRSMLQPAPVRPPTRPDTEH